MHEGNLNYPLYTALLTWSGLIILASMYATIPITESMMESLSISKTKAVWITSSFSLSYGISCLFFGPISDRYGRKIMLIIGLATLTFFTFIFYFVTSFPLLIIIRILQGASSAMFVPISLAYVADVYPTSKRLNAIAIISSGFLTSTVLAQVFSMVINHLFNWQMNFMILAYFYSITLMCIYFVLPKEQQVERQSTLLEQFLRIKNVIRHQYLIICFFISFTLLFSLVGMYTMLGKYFSSEPYNFTDSQLLIVRAIGLIGVLLCFFANILSKVFGIIKVLRFGLILSAISLYTLGNIYSPFFAILFSVLFVAGISLIVPTNINLVSTYSGNQRGTAVLFNAFILFVGASLGPLIATKLMTFGNFFVSYFIFSIILAVAFLLSLYLKLDMEETL